MAFKVSGFYSPPVGLSELLLQFAQRNAGLTAECGRYPFQVARVVLQTSWLKSVICVCVTFNSLICLLLQCKNVFYSNILNQTQSTTYYF